MKRNAWIEIDLKAIKKNILFLKKLSNNSKFLMPVKANAYGHGIFPIAEFVSKENLCDYLGVAYDIEAKELIENIDSPKQILVFTMPEEENIEFLIKNNIYFTVFTEKGIETTETIAKKIGKKATVHLKIDTGMHRIGAKIDQGKQLLQKINKSEFINLDGIFTHFADSDDLSSSYYEEQLSEFKIFLNHNKDDINNNVIIHAANSGAVLRSSLENQESSIFDMIRPGLSSYGYFPNINSKDLFEENALLPALKVYATITHVKTLEKGNSVGYGRNFFCDKDTKIATISLGNGDGFYRKLGLIKFNVTVNDTLCPIVGSVAMDQMMIDVTNTNAKIGDIVTFFDNENTSVDAMAKALDMITYEITTRLLSRLPRIYI